MWYYFLYNSIPFELLLVEERELYDVEPLTIPNNFFFLPVPSFDALLLNIRFHIFGDFTKNTVNREMAHWTTKFVDNKINLN